MTNYAISRPVQCSFVKRGVGPVLTLRLCPNSCRSNSVLIAALPSGFLLGAIVFVGFSVFGNPDWRAYLTPGAVLNGATQFGVVGLVVAALSVLGGALSVALVARRLVHESAARILAGGLGSAVGVGIGGIALGLAQSSTFTAFVGLLLALPAGIIAAIGIGSTDRAARS